MIQYFLYVMGIVSVTALLLNIVMEVVNWFLQHFVVSFGPMPRYDIKNVAYYTGATVCLLAPLALLLAICAHS